MITINYIKPFRTDVAGSQWRLIFEYQYFAIIKDGERYNFIPTEDKEIIIDLKTRLVDNTSDVFVFHRGPKFIRLTLQELLLTSDLKDHLYKIIDEPSGPIVYKDTDVTEQETEQLIQEIEQMHIKYEIDRFLETRDYEVIRELVEVKNV